MFFGNNSQSALFIKKKDDVNTYFKVVFTSSFRLGERKNLNFIGFFIRYVLDQNSAFFYAN